MTKLPFFSFLLLCCFSMQAQRVNTVAGIVLTPGSIDGNAQVATFHNPHGIAVDDLGNIYTCDRWSHLIRKISPDGVVSTFAGSPGESGTADGVGQEARFNEPWGICVGNDGNVFVADTRNNKIRKITPDGQVTTFAGSGSFGATNGFGTAATFGNPTGIEMDNAGNLYIADHLTHIIRKIDPLGFVSTIAGSAFLPGDAEGVGSAAKFNRPYGLTIDHNGDILVADEWNHKIKKVTPQGEVTTVAGAGTIGHNNGNAGFATFNYPWDVAVDNFGNIFVGDGYNHLIRKINTSGQVTTFAGTPQITGGVDGPALTASFNGATGVAFWPLDNKLYIADAYNNLVREIVDLESDGANNPQSIFLSLVHPDNFNNVICPDDTIIVQAAPAIYEQYYFYQNDLLVQSGSSAFLETIPDTSGTHFLQVVALKDGVNYASGVVHVIALETDKVSIEILGSEVLSSGDSVILSAGNPESCLWSTGATTPTIIVHEAGIYGLEVKDENGCRVVAEPVEISAQQEIPSVVVSVIGATRFCTGENTILESNFTENLQWYKNDFPLSGKTDAILQVSQAGRYKVGVNIPEHGIFFSDEIEIKVLPPLELNFSAEDTTGTTTTDFQFNCPTENVNSLLWDFGDVASGENNFSELLAPVHRFSSAGFYSVTLIGESNDGCRDTLQRTNYIMVENENPVVEEEAVVEETEEEIEEEVVISAIKTPLFIPDAFTPNEDGLNDRFVIKGQNFTDFNLKIFNHWGELIFESNEAEQGWDGTFNGLPVQMGSYAYLICYKNTSGEENVESGLVTVLR